MMYEKTTCHIHRFVCNKNKINNNSTSSESSVFTPEMSLRIHTHQLCIIPISNITSDDNINSEKNTYITWFELVQIATYNLIRMTSPLYMKLDMNGHEYSILPSILKSKFMLPIQISFKLNMATSIYPGLPWIQFRKDFNIKGSLYRLPSNEPAKQLYELINSNGYKLISKLENHTHFIDYSNVVIMLEKYLPV